MNLWRPVTGKEKCFAVVIDSHIQEISAHESEYQGFCTTEPLE